MHNQYTGMSIYCILAAFPQTKHGFGSFIYFDFIFNHCPFVSVKKFRCIILNYLIQIFLLCYNHCTLIILVCLLDLNECKICVSRYVLCDFSQICIYQLVKYYKYYLYHYINNTIMKYHF